MPEVECNICCKKFKSLYLLQRHQQRIYVCERPTPETHRFECSICKYKFTLVQNYNRHVNNRTCVNRPITTPTSIPTIISPISILENNITNNNTTNNTNNTNNGDVNNGTINDNRQITNNITNNIIIQHINPFGHENTDFLSNQEKLNILRSGHTACIKILKIVYNRNENKNFYKVNKKSSTITYLKDTVNSRPNTTTSNTSPTITSSNNTNIIDISDITETDSNSLIDVFQHREFRKEIFNNSTTLLYSIMLDCKNDLCFEEQLSLMDNINSIKNDVYNEIFTNSLSNLRREIGDTVLDIETKEEINWGIENVISNEIENYNESNRKKILNYVKHINNEPIVKDLFITKLAKEKRKRNKIKRELNDKSLQNDVNNQCGRIEYTELANELQVTHFPATNFAKKLSDREKIEETLVKNNVTLGKLNAYNSIQKERKYNINSIMKYENDREKLRELSNGE